MEVTVVEREPMTIVGWQAKFIHVRSPDANGMSVIGNLWRNVFKFDVLKALPGSLGHPTWGVIWGDPVPQRSRIDELNYLAGVPFAGVPALPAGISYRNVPGGSYASITHRGPLSGLPQTIEHLYANWLPGSGYEHAGQCDLELYDERFFKEGPEQEFDYFISVKPAAVVAEPAPAPQVTIAAATDKDSEDTGARSRTFNERKKTDALHPSSKPAAKPKKQAKAKKPAKKAAKKATKKKAAPKKKAAAKKKPAQKAHRKVAKKSKKKAIKKAVKKAPKKRSRR
jgi:predicted transcriptional regulator YdeE